MIEVMFEVMRYFCLHNLFIKVILITIAHGPRYRLAP